VRQLLRLIAWCLVFLGSNSAFSAAEPVVELRKQDHGVAVMIAGQEFTTYHTDPKWQKPFFSPVKTADGSIITRSLESPESKDHPHHKGIWLAIDEVNGSKHWAEKSTIKNVSVDLIKAVGNPAVMRVVNHWLGENGQPAVIETTDISIYTNRLLAYDIHFQAGNELVTWGDTKEGLFGIRVADTMREKQPAPEKDKADSAPRKGGQVVNADGLKTTAECWGKTSAWVDYSGLVDGKVEGVAIFDHPLNFRPSRYHVRDYGLFTISPFGQKAYSNGALPADEYLQPAGSTIRLRYAIYIHPGDAEQGNVAQTYVNYLKAAGD
jgi:hypothetical protein